MRDVRLYKFSLVLTIICFGVSCIFALMDASEALGSLSRTLLLIFALLAILGLLGVGHLRMRMMFSSLNSKASRNERLVSNISNQNSVLASNLKALEESFSRGKDAAPSTAMLKIADVEREIIANDSFNEARANMLLREQAERFNSQSAEQAKLASALEKRGQELSAIYRLVESNESRLNEIGILASSLHEKENDRYTDLCKRLDAYEVAVDYANSRVTAMFAEQEEVKRTGLSIEELSDVLESSIAKLEGRIDTSTSMVSDRIFGTEGKLSQALSEGKDLLAAKIESSSKKTCIRVDQSADSVEEQIDRATIAVRGLVALVEELRQDEAESRTEFLAVRSDVQGEIAKIGRQLSSLREARSVELQHLRDAICSGLDQSLANVVSNNRILDLEETMNESFESLSSRTQTLFNATQSKLNQLRVAAEELPKEVSDFAALLARFGIDSASSPRIGGWAATVPAIRTIVCEIVENEQVRAVLDVGSGTSTFWSALAFRERGYGKCFALEHDSQYVERMNSLLEAHGLSEWAEVVHAPLVPWKPQLRYSVESEFLPNQWYETDRIPDEEFDIVFVDGPPGHAHEYSRLPAFELLSSRLRDGSMIVLDDTIRVEEKGILKLWQDVVSESGRLAVEDNLSKSTVLRFISGDTAGNG